MTLSRSELVPLLVYYCSGLSAMVSKSSLLLVLTCVIDFFLLVILWLFCFAML